MRRRQLTALRWKDIDFDKKTILLTLEGSKSKREWEIPIPPQSEAGLRHLFLASQALHQRLEDSQVFRVQWFENSFGGAETTPKQLSYAFNRISDHLGVTVSAHRLRHTMATDLATGLNPDLKSLQYLLGHANLATTMEYITPEMEQLRTQMSKLKIGDFPEIEQTALHE
jgi:integrase